MPTRLSKVYRGGAFVEFDGPQIVRDGGFQAFQIALGSFSASSLNISSGLDVLDIEGKFIVSNLQVINAARAENNVVLAILNVDGVEIVNHAFVLSPPYILSLWGGNYMQSPNMDRSLLPFLVRNSMTLRLESTGNTGAAVSANIIAIK